MKSWLNRTFFLICAFIFIANLVDNKIFVVSPPDLANKFKERTIEGTLSKFGRIPYGFSIMGNIIYKPDENGLNTGCSASSGMVASQDFEYSIDDVPIYMIDRGDCTFVKKVENAELNGALAVIIVDNKEEQVKNKVMMADDGKGNNITIPAILINKKDGETIKKYLNDNPGNTAVIEIDFEMVLLNS